MLYRSSGLSISSNLPIPEFLAASDCPTSGQAEPDVYIKQRPLREACLPRAPYWKDWNEVKIGAQPNECWIQFDNGSRIDISQGNSIELWADSAQVPGLLPYLTGSAWGLLLMQRGLTVLHGSAVLGPRGATLLVGHQGRGKSTTAAALSKLGYPTLCDDLCALQLFSSSGPALWPTSPRLRLLSDSLRWLDADGYAANSDSKTYWSFEQPHAEIGREAISVHQIVWLRLLQEGQYDWEVVDQLARRHCILLEHVYRRQFLSPMGMNKVNFQDTLDLATKLPLVILARPQAPLESSLPCVLQSLQEHL